MPGLQSWLSHFSWNMDRFTTLSCLPQFPHKVPIIIEPNIIELSWRLKICNDIKYSEKCLSHSNCAVSIGYSCNYPDLSAWKFLLGKFLIVVFFLYSHTFSYVLTFSLRKKEGDGWARTWPAWVLTCYLEH